MEEKVVDLLVEEYLRTLDQIGIPDDAPDHFDEAGHHAFVRKAAQAAIVLLKNDAQLLPLAQGTRVAVIGDFAETPRYQGAGSSNVHSIRVDHALNCLKSSGLEVVGYEPGFLRHGGEDALKLVAAVELSRRADVVLLFLGLDELAESEGMDRITMKLRDNQVASGGE